MARSMTFRRVGGAQAEQARSLGLVKISMASARGLFNAGVPIIMVGNNVNSYHFFKGGGLAHTVDPERYKSEAVLNTFDAIHRDFLFYLEPELGRSAAFFVESKYIE